jgi:hypothetical protein
VKLDRNGLQFYHRVMDKQWDWVRVFKPPRVHSLPDILTQEETALLITLSSAVSMGKGKAKTSCGATIFYAHLRENARLKLVKGFDLLLLGRAA